MLMVLFTETDAEEKAISYTSRGERGDRERVRERERERERECIRQREVLIYYLFSVNIIVY
jgi:hypothetical protein